jgi:hypothetical protein
MKRITHISVSALAMLVVTAALVAPASAYQSINAASHPVASSDQGSGQTGTSINAILGESTPVAAAESPRPGFSTPNAILGSANVSEPVVTNATSTDSTGFDWNDALVGAGSALVLVLLAGGAMALGRHRRAPRAQPTA